jgi:hypothetical protein
MKSVYEPSRSYIDFHIAGFGHHNGVEVFDELKIGTKVELRYEPDNPHDSEAVAIYYANTKIGYVPTGKNSELFMLLYYGHDDLFETYINMFDEKAHPERQFRVAVKVKDRR